MDATEFQMSYMKQHCVIANVQRYFLVHFGDFDFIIKVHAQS